jgi:MHS family proline/betaine transporter-like MFS transporter
MSTIAAAAADPAITVSRRGIAVAAAASCLGWSLALFDLLILLYVAPVVGRLFFPANSPMLSLAAVYAGFAVTMVMRPVSAAVFGRYSDLRGRKPAMLVAVMGVRLVTASFGALPTVSQIGTRNPPALARTSWWSCGGSNRDSLGDAFVKFRALTTA